MEHSQPLANRGQVESVPGYSLSQGLTLPASISKAAPARGCIQVLPLAHPCPGGATEQGPGAKCSLHCRQSSPSPERLSCSSRLGNPQ